MRLVYHLFSGIACISPSPSVDLGGFPKVRYFPWLAAGRYDITDTTDSIGISRNIGTDRPMG